MFENWPSNSLPCLADFLELLMMTVSRNLAASNKCFYSFKKGKSAICAAFFVCHPQKSALNTHDDFLFYVNIYIYIYYQHPPMGCVQTLGVA